MFILTIPYQLPCRSFLEFQGSILGPLLFIIYMNDLPSCLTVILFIDDTKIYNVASNPQDLQRDLDSATLWSEIWDMYFNPTKSIHFRINAKAITKYRIADTNIVTKNVHKDLMCDDLSWNEHYEK